MAGMLGSHPPKVCCFHGPGLPSPLGLSKLDCSQPAQDMLNMLGLTGQQMKDDLVYKYNLGGGQVFPTSDWKQALDQVLERDLPDIYHDRQVRGCFIPETNEPKNPRASMDLAGYNATKRLLEQDASGLDQLKFLGIKPGTEDSQNVEGEEVERNLNNELKVVFAAGEIVVLHGPVFRKPNTPPGNHEEKDFVLVDKNLKLVLGIECKQSLTNSTARSSGDQLRGLQDVLEQYFGPHLSSVLREENATKEVHYLSSL